MLTLSRIWGRVGLWAVYRLLGEDDEPFDDDPEED